jgi:hypothetical protein
MSIQPQNLDTESLVSRIRAEVQNESRMAERGYFVGDLQSQLKGFGKADAAWEVSYKTTSAEALNLGLKDKVAWEISYKTTSVAALDKGNIR